MAKLSTGVIIVILIGIVATAPLVYFILVNNSNDSVPTLVLATTTSTDNSGLLDYLHLEMKKDLNLNVDVVAVGTGAALELARSGLADAVMVHARSLEDQFVNEGYGLYRVDLMYNDFVIVGPPNDPAQIKGLENVTEVFLKLYQKRDNIIFYSRGDNSGTHIKELSLWNSSGITIDSDNVTWAQTNQWYLETGTGMGSTLTTTSTTSKAYTITDRATFLFMEDNLDLEILYEGTTNETQLQNPYGAILVNPEKFEANKIKFDLAKEYVKWLISPRGQDLINGYKIKGKQVFFADFMNHYDTMPADEKSFWGFDTT